MMGRAGLLADRIDAGSRELTERVEGQRCVESLTG